MEFREGGGQNPEMRKCALAGENSANRLVCSATQRTAHFDGRDEVFYVLTGFGLLGAVLL